MKAIALGRTMGLAAAASLAAFLLSVAATPGPAGARVQRQGGLASCSTPGALGAWAPGEVTADGYVPLSCPPMAQPAPVFGGALAGAYTAAFDQEYENPILPAVVDERGNAWLVAGRSTGADLEEVSPSGRLLTSIALAAPADLVAGDSRLLVLRDADGRFTLYDTRAHVAATVTPPAYAQAQQGQINIVTAAGAVGALAVLETSQYAGNGQGVATQAGRVEVYGADGALLRSFPLPHRRVAAQPDEPNDSARIVSFGDVAYLVWNDLPAGDQAGVFEIRSSGQVDGPFPLPARFTDGPATEALALPGGRLLVGNPSTGEAVLVSLSPAGLRLLWRRPLVGGGWRLGGAYVVTAGDVLRAYRIGDGRLMFATGRRNGYSLEPLVAGPFGVVSEAKSATGPPELILFGPSGRMVWRTTVPTGRMTPLATTFEGRPAVYLGPNLPVLVWR